MKKVLIIESSPLLVISVKSVLNAENDINVIDAITDVSNLKKHLSSRVPDVIVLNPSVIDRKERDNIRYALDLDKSTLLIALISSLHESSILQQFDAVVSIFDTPSTLINAIRHVKANDNMPLPSENEPLTDREKEILVSVAKGLTNKEIAEKFFISIHTVISHRKNIVKKTGIKTVSGLTVFALINKLVSTDEI